MRPFKQQQKPGMFPSLLVFGPQAHPSSADLAELRSQLISSTRLSKLLISIRRLPELWPRLIRLDPELERIPGDSLLKDVAEWLAPGHAGLGSFPHRPSDMPATLAFPINFLFQIVQYHGYLEQYVQESDAQQSILKKIQAGGAQGFCLGFLSAITVATSGSEDQLIEIAIRALKLAVCIGAYVDKDAATRTNERATCISVRGRQTLDKTGSKVAHILGNFPKAYVSAVTDDVSMTITTFPSELSKLATSLADVGFVVQQVPVDGRFHCSIYDSEVDRLVDFFAQCPGLRMPSSDQLYVPVRSAVDGTVISTGNLVRHALENTLLRPVEWYKTLRLSVAALPPGRRHVALGGVSSHFPPSLLSLHSDVQLLRLHGSRTREYNSKTSSKLHVDNNDRNDYQKPSGLYTPPSPAHTDTDDDGVLSLEDGCNTASHSSTQSKLPTSGLPPHSVAIVGMAGRFPGANSVDELWELLSAGRSMVNSTPERVGLDQLTDKYSDVRWWGNFLDEYDTFDHKFFNKSAREATACDPQQRKLLEVVYDALVSSGQLGAEASSGSASTDYGCYIGAVANNYATNITCHPPTAYATTGTTRAFLSGAISHHFGWTGPAMTIDTACSSSLVAIHTACRAIAAGECSRAVAGGTNIITCPFDYRDLKAAGFLSPTGQCKPFDADADGYCRGEAVSVVVLKSLSAAIEDNDNILGVVAGSATSQNNNEGPIVVPDATSQAKLLTKAIDMSNILPGDVTYVEAHGTGTSVGDPIEVQSLREAFGGPSRKSTLHFSSIKGNIGHAESASGVAGLVKVLLMLKYGHIPPQASHQALNPKIPALEPDRMAIPQQMMPWTPSRERIACVNNYGAAGSNSVLMIREAPALRWQLEASKNPNNTAVNPKWPLIISASTRTSLSLYGQKLLEYVRRLRSNETSASNISIPDILFSLAQRADLSLNNVVATSVTDMSELQAVLSAMASDDGGGVMATTPSPSPPVVLVFGGQEGLFVGLSEAVYQSSQVFRHHLDICHNLALSLGLFGPAGLYPAVFQQAPIQDLVTLHVALFGVQYSCAKAWMDCGLKVAAVIGHSFGQLTALCLSGVLSLSDTLRLVAGRASLVEKQWGSESGSMIALQTDREHVDEVLDQVRSQTGGYAEIACMNTPRSHVVVGSRQTVRDIETMLTDSNNTGPQGAVRSQRLNVTHGFHSRFTETLLPQLAELADTLEWRSPTIHLEVCSENVPANDHEPDQYRQLTVEHTRRPVYFHQAVQRLMERYPQATWLEAGRGLSAIQLARACAQHTNRQSFVSPQLTTANAQDSLLDTTVRLWKEGHAVQYWPFHRSQRWQYQHLSLPPYQFQKNRHWLPYIKPTTTTAESVKVKSQEAKDELICLINGEKSSIETRFRVSPPGSKRFEALVAGHVVCGQTLMPASAYIEVASRAALLLQEDLKAESWVPTVENLTMRAPIAFFSSDHAPPYITMVMHRLDSSWPSWSFSFIVDQSTSEKVANASVATHETTTGTVHLHKRTDPNSQVAQDVRRLSAMMGHHRWEQIMYDPEAQGMRGRHIYRAFSQVVDYSEAFRGVKSIMCLESDAAGIVKITPDSNDPPDQRLTDTPMIDSFMQFGGLLANYFNEAVSPPDSVFICHQIQRLQVGPAFSPDGNEWFVLANMTSIDQDNLSVDVYVLEAQSRRMVLTALGMSFAKTTRASLVRMLRGDRPMNDSYSDSECVTKGRGTEDWQAAKSEATSRANNAKDKHTISSKRAEILRITASIADLPEHELSGETSIAAIVDSLGATEMIGDINTILGVTIDLTTFLLFPDINAVISHVDTQLGVAAGDDDDAVASPPIEGQGLALTSGSIPISTSQSYERQVGNGLVRNNHSAPTLKADTFTQPTIDSIHKFFDDARLTFDELGAATHALEYWSDYHPDDVRLVLAYTTEALRQLGCNMQTLRPGETLPEVKGILPRHGQLVRRLYRFLEEQDLIEHRDSGGFIRTATAIDATPAEQIFHQVIGKHPLNASVRHLMQAIGPHFADCLKGDVDALQILFGNRSTKKWLDELYREWPMLVTATQLLGNFLCQTFTESLNSQANSGIRTGPFRILEIGAGTGGTTRHIVNLLRARGIPFEYHFTDISVSLVQKAKTAFGGADDMRFCVLDIESEPELEPAEAFHAIISTNCIHATKNITRSLSNLRKMLRDDGALALIEMTPDETHALYVMDVIVGLLEGWWLFDDGRSHALADVERWARAFADAGFREVLWSDGASLEARTVRVICGFRQSRPDETKKKSVLGVGRPVDVSIQEVVYKMAGSQKVHADIYCPASADPAKKMPIALMIHGGSHILFSRKDIRPPQTRIMLDMGLLPVSLDHRLCPETRLVEGPMVDVCDALEWARTRLPSMELQNPNIRPDPDNIVVVGWSSGGQLALSTGWTAPERGLKPPAAILAFYSPTDYEDDWWKTPIQPIGAEDWGAEYDVLEAVEDEPITSYGTIGAWEPLSDPRIHSDPRARIVLHMNWKAQTLPVVIGGLCSRNRPVSCGSSSGTFTRGKITDWNALPMPPVEEIRRCSPLAQVRQGNYTTPTFLVHGTADDLIPWQQSYRTVEEMRARGVDAQLVLVPEGPHVCDTSHDPDSPGWKAVLEAYSWLGYQLFAKIRHG